MYRTLHEVALVDATQSEYWRRIGVLDESQAASYSQSIVGAGECSQL